MINSFILRPLALLTANELKVDIIYVKQRVVQYIV